MSKNDPVNEMLPAPKLFALGLQHVFVMYAGAIAVPLILGRALELNQEQVAFLISADLFACGVISIIQSMGITKWFGIRLPVMMGVSFAAVGPMLAIAGTHKGAEGLQLIFGAIIGAGLITILIAPLMGKMLRFFPSIVTGTIITVIGITLMRIGVNWIFGLPVGPTSPKIVNPEWTAWLESAKTAAGSTVPEGLSLASTVDNPAYASPINILLSIIVLMAIMLVTRFGKGFFSNISVLIGIIIGGVIAAMLGLMHFDKVADAASFGFIKPFNFGMPIFDPVLIFTMTVVLIVIMIESIGMFLALGDITGKKISDKDITSGLRADGLGAIIGGIFNTYPYTSFSQNVGLVGVTGVKSRWVAVMGGAIMIVLGLIPKMGALVEALPTAVLGGAGLVMFGMVAATGIRVLSRVDFNANRNNLFIVAISIGMGMIPLVAPDFKMWMPHAIHPIVDSGILLAAISAVLLNLLFNGATGDADDARHAAKVAEH